MDSILLGKTYFFIQFILCFSIVADLFVWFFNGFMFPSWILSVFFAMFISLFYVIREMEKDLNKEVPSRTQRSKGKIILKKRVDKDERDFR